MLTLTMALMAAPAPAHDRRAVARARPRGDEADSSNGCGSCGTPARRSWSSSSRSTSRSSSPTAPTSSTTATVRYAGPTAGLLDRPDLVRATFLAPRRRAASRAAPRRQLRSRPARRGSSSPGSGSRFGGVVALDDVSLDRRTRARSSGSSGPNGAGKTTLFDVVSGFVPPDAGIDRARATTVRGRADGTAAAPARATRARAVVPGRPPLPGAHRARDHRGRVRTVGAGPQPGRGRRCTSPRSRAPSAAVARACRRARRAARARRLHRPVRPRALDRHPPHRRPRVRPRARALGAAPRRAGQRDRAARGRGSRSDPARRARHARRGAARHRARPRCAGDGGRPTRGPRPRSRGRRRALRAPCSPTPRWAGRTSAADQIGRSPCATMPPCGFRPAGPRVPWPACSWPQPSLALATPAGAAGGQARAPLTFDQAKAAGTKVDWGPNCDTTTGKVAVPSGYAPPCVAALEGRRQRRRHRTGRHQGHDHHRAVPGPARPPAAGVLRADAGATRAWPRSARPPRSTSTTSRRTTSSTGAR